MPCTIGQAAKASGSGSPAGNRPASWQPTMNFSRMSNASRPAIEVVALAPYSWFEAWQETSWKRRGPAYDAFKQELSIPLQNEIEQRVPAVSGKIDYAELSTPLSTRHFMNYEWGESYGLSATPARFRLRCLTPRTPIRNLYLTGQDVVSLGVIGALLGGVVTASAILRRNLMATLVKPERTAINRISRRGVRETVAGDRLTGRARSRATGRARPHDVDEVLTARRWMTNQQK
jgi:hypothetical protein